MALVFEVSRRAQHCADALDCILNSHFHFNGWMRIVINNFEIVECKIFNSLHAAFNTNGWKCTGNTSNLQKQAQIKYINFDLTERYINVLTNNLQSTCLFLQRFHMIQIHMCITQCVYKITRFQTSHLGNHIR